VPPASTTTSRPGRLLAALAALLILMLLGVLGANLASPGTWHKSFKVGLGLDLSWGTQVTLKAEPPPGHGVTAGAMSKAKSIMFSRVNASGFVGATVVQQGSDEIVVSVPHQNAEAVANLVGTTAQLSFRQVLFGAPALVPAGTAKSSPSASPSASAAASPSPSASASASATPSASATATPTPTPSASSSGKPVPSTTSNGAGNLSALTSQTVADFNRLNCADKQWQKVIYGSNPNGWARPTQQAVGCYSLGNGVVYKYAMAPPVIIGTDLTSVSATLNPQGAGWIVNFGVKTRWATKLGNLTQTMASLNASASSNPADSFLSQLAVVLDGQIQSSPNVQGQITTSGEINGGTTGFTQSQATRLANLLKYGQLPLKFQTQDSSTVSPQLGTAQLSAGIIAGLIGLMLVVIYSFLYYRGLAVVSVSSLAIAAAITYLSVILLSKYESFNLTLAGIAGLIVAIGITADSFVVYFERLRDEVREGKSLRAAVERGWTRARRTIIVSDTVSFLAALLLYIFAIGDVRAFAFTLGLTTLVDIVVVFLFTKPMISLLARTRFFGQGHRFSGLDPARLGARAPWRGTRRPPRPAPGTAGGAAATPKEA
jgi:preprotein translocase subunit SecD